MSFEIMSRFLLLVDHCSHSEAALAVCNLRRCCSHVGGPSLSGGHAIVFALDVGAGRQTSPSYALFLHGDARALFVLEDRRWLTNARERRGFTFQHPRPGTMHLAMLDRALSLRLRCRQGYGLHPRRPEVITDSIDDLRHRHSMSHAGSDRHRNGNQHSAQHGFYLPPPNSLSAIVSSGPKPPA